MFILISNKSSRVGGYRLLQNIIENGVMNAAKTDEVAVRLTERAVLALANNAIKFEVLPPGQHAIKIIPRATRGCGLIAKHMSKVSSGRPIICAAIPVKYSLGWVLKKAKLEGRRPSATANIMTAKTIAIPISDDVPMSSWKLSRASEFIMDSVLACKFACANFYFAFPA